MSPPRLQRLALLYLVAVFTGVWGYLVGAHQAFPHRMISETVREVRAFVQGGEGEQKSGLEILTTPLQEQRNRFDFGGFRRVDPDFVDPGYMLLPRWSPERGRAIVELIRLADFRAVHRWMPDLEVLASLGDADAPKAGFSTPDIGLRLNHALLMPDGSLIFGLGHGPLARVDRDGSPVWVIGGLFHHSIEQTPDGDLIAIADLVPGAHRIPHGLVDEGYVLIAPEGEVLGSESIPGLLSRTGLDWLQLGMGELDPTNLLHLNDVQPVHQDAGILKRGDLLLSLRNRSTVLIYRPADDRIVAAHSGPWMLQHDPDPLADGRVAVFDNRAYLAPDRQYVTYGDHSSVVIWDPRTDEIARPFDAVLRSAALQSTVGGQVSILPNGDALIEESVWRRLLRTSDSQVRWEYVNADPADHDAAGMIHWARYLPPEDPALRWLNETP